MAFTERNGFHLIQKRTSETKIPFRDSDSKLFLLHFFKCACPLLSVDNSAPTQPILQKIPVQVFLVFVFLGSHYPLVIAELYLRA